MDCYFRQYWRDKRLSFKGLKNNANNLIINQLSLNVAMLEKIWKPGNISERIVMKMMMLKMLQILTSIMVLTRTCIKSPDQTNCSESLRMETSHTLSGKLIWLVISRTIIYPQAHSKSKVPDDPQKFPHGPTDLSSHTWFM
jgi:hypothetical protein